MTSLSRPRTPSLNCSTHLRKFSNCQCKQSNKLNQTSLQPSFSKLGILGLTAATISLMPATLALQEAQTGTEDKLAASSSSPSPPQIALQNVVAKVGARS